MIMTIEDDNFTEIEIFQKITLPPLGGRFFSNYVSSTFSIQKMNVLSHS